MASQETSHHPTMGTPGVRPSGTSSSSNETSLSETVITLRKRRWIIIGCALLGLFFGLYKAASTPKIYVATAQIQVRTGSANQFRISGPSEYFGGSVSPLTTEVNILQSDSLLATVARELNLPNNPIFTGWKTSGPTHFSIDTPWVRQSVVGKLQSNLKVSLVLKTDLISIAYSSPNAKLSADIVNKLISDYIERSYETRYQSTQRVSHWLGGTLDDLRREVETSQEKVMEVQRRLGILGLDPTHSEIATGLDDLTRAADEAKIARIAAEARYHTLSHMGADLVEPAGSGVSMPSLPPAAPAPATTAGATATTGATAGSSGIVGVTGASEARAPGAGTRAPAAGATTNSGELASLRSQLANLETEYAQSQTTLGPNHPTVRAELAQIAELNKQIQQEQHRMIAASQEAYLMARNTENATTSSLDTAKNNAYKLRDDLVEYSLRQREYEANRTLYDSLRQRLRAASIQAGLESLEIDIVDPATPPAGPMASSKSKIILVSLIFGIMVGIGLAFLVESLDTGLSSITEIENITELPSLAIIPRSKRSTAEPETPLSPARRNLNVLIQPKSQFAEAVRSLRTSLLLSTTGHPPKYIVFTSATPSEGKTTIASNLACVLAQGESRVLLIDADLRRPNVHHRFGLNGKVGLSTLLTGSTTLEDSVQPIAEVPNLRVMPSGPIPPFPTEMLTSQAMDDLLRQCGTLYDHVIIDSPPVLSVTDGVLLARKADAVALVIRHGKSSKHVVKRARDMLLRAGASITGIVLNAVDLNAPEYYGYYGYSGYSYSSIDAESWEAQSSGSKSGRS